MSDPTNSLILDDGIRVGVLAWENCASVSQAIAEWAADNNLRLGEQDFNYIIEYVWVATRHSARLSTDQRQRWLGENNA